MENRIVKSIRAALEKNTKVNLHRFPIHVAMQNGDVILEGDVEDIAAKKTALRLAAERRGVRGIVDRLRVVPAQKMGDEEIRDRVCKALLGEPAFEHCVIRGRDGEVVETVREAATDGAGSIVVAVSDGVVTLNGTVPSLSHKRLAGVLAWWVPGCRDVINGLEEVPPEQDSDDELADAVRLVLEKDPFVDADRIAVRCRAGTVTLTGTVPTEATRKMAEMDAWYVLGVERVDNRLRVEE
ncbi:MAG TPA: BON domain-containing protein [candidate division Zixibacteria bacterium]|nr:BON domain-containing protein [candidate division Zixibacteria bacterium]